MRLTLAGELKITYIKSCAACRSRSVRKRGLLPQDRGGNHLHHGESDARRGNRRTRDAGRVDDSIHHAVAVDRASVLARRIEDVSTLNRSEVRSRSGKEARAHRDEARRIEWLEKGMFLTREQAAAGEPCRGCGLPLIDNLGDWGGTMYLTPEQRIEYDADQDMYREMHPSCDAHRWSMQGSRATHCGYCCPPLPMSREQSENIGRLLASLPERREEELDIWERILTCGHKVEQSVHHTNKCPSFSTARCPECEVTRGVASSEKIVEAAARMAEAIRKHDDRVARAERELKKAEKAVAEAHTKLAEAQSDG